MTRVVFLDIDGVLAHTSSNDLLDPACLARLDEMLRVTSAQLVLTSSWRDTFGVPETQRRLAAAGLQARIYEAVPAMPQATRSDEIVAYLAGRRGLEQFVILDDTPVDKRLRSRLVLIDDFVGLTDTDIALARRLLP
jgi:hypothetical protein